MSKLELWKGSHSVHQIAYHIIWCTKFRHQVLVGGPDIIVKQTIGQACLTYEWACRALEVMPDHVHCFIQVKHTDSPVNVAKTLKSLTALAVFCAYPKLKQQKFWGTGLWSPSTFYSSVGNISQETVHKYIEDQKSK